jgi:hypothetical protein
MKMGHELDKDYQWPEPQEQAHASSVPAPVSEETNESMSG